MALVGFLLYFSFAAFFTTFSDGSICKEVRTLRLVDCSGLGLSKLPKFSGKLKWAVTVNLRRNLITGISERELLSVFPGVVLVDLRGNPINCKELATFRRVRVLTDCVAALSPSFGTSDTTYTSTDVLLSTKCETRNRPIRTLYNLIYPAPCFLQLRQCPPGHGLLHR